MSTFSFPDLMKPETMFEAMPDMSEWMRTMPAMPVPPLMVHPVAASAAASAVGIGIAAQMIGMFAGSLQGAMEISRKYGMPAPDAIFDRPAANVAAPESPQVTEPVAAKTAARKPRKAAAGKTDAAAKRQTADKADAAVSGLKAAANTAAHAVTETRDAAPVERTEGKRVLAPEDYKRPAELARPAKPDDLKRISGIGPKLEEVLNSLGIWTFDQVAGWTAEEVGWLDDYLQFRGRIERDTWREQAAEFAKAK